MNVKRESDLVSGEEQQRSGIQRNFRRRDLRYGEEEEDTGVPGLVVIRSGQGLQEERHTGGRRWVWDWVYQV